MLEPVLCSSRVFSPLREESSDEELSVLPRHTKVVVTGNNRTKYVLAPQVKSNISQFSGFVWHGNEEKQKNKIKEKLEKCVKEKLLEICDLLDLPVARARKFLESGKCFYLRGIVLCYLEQHLR